MNWLDRFIRARRIHQVVRVIPPGSRVFDIGCHDGALFKALGGRLAAGLGVDPSLPEAIIEPLYKLTPSTFPSELSIPSASFDCVCALAVLEHVIADHTELFIREIVRLVRADGLAILTVPSPCVDLILSALIRFRLLDGMEADQHHAFDVTKVVPLFESAGLKLDRHRRFQLGLNNLFVFRKPGDALDKQS